MVPWDHGVCKDTNDNRYNWTITCSVLGYCIEDMMKSKKFNLGNQSHLKKEMRCYPRPHLHMDMERKKTWRQRSDTDEPPII